MQPSNNLIPFISQVAIGKLPKLKVYGDDYDTKDGTGVRDYIHLNPIEFENIEDVLNDLENFWQDIL